MGTFHYRATGDAEIGRYDKGADVGEGVLWDAQRTSARRMRDGRVGEAISIADATALTAGFGVQVPPPAALASSA